MSLLKATGRPEKEKVHIKYILTNRHIRGNTAGARGNRKCNSVAVYCIELWLLVDFMSRGCFLSVLPTWSLYVNSDVHGQNLKLQPMVGTCLVCLRISLPLPEPIDNPVIHK